MTLRFRHLEIRAVTQAGTVGTNINFVDGLNVLAAPNTSGKSTCVMSLLYALGLEGMLGPSQSPPLTDALQRSILIGNREFAVVAAHVRVEIENHKHERFTATRQVTGTTKDRQLIRGVMGADLTEPNSAYQRKDFYVRTQGAAQNELGFHRFLAEFMGLDLPRVPGAEAESVPLYLECLFPFFFVDQMTGWRDVKSRMPSYLRVPEMAKRATEYILGLDILRRAIERQLLEQRTAELRNQWSRVIERAKVQTAAENVVLRGIPESPQAAWPPSPAPQALYSDGENWIELSHALQNLRERQKQIVDEEIPRAEQVSQEVIADLRKSEERLAALTNRLDQSSGELVAERAHVGSIHKRLQALQDDLKDYIDLKRVLDRGGDAPLKTAELVCPTCHQEIKDALLPQERSATPMTLDENIEFIRDQIATFVRMRRDAIEVLEAKEQQRSAISDRIHDVSQQVRALKRTLHSDGRVPSVAAVREHVALDESADKLQEAAEQVGKFMTTLGQLSQEWVQATARLKSLAGAQLSDMDEKKLAHLQSSFVDQLGTYNFSSFLIEHLSMSRESYRPTRDGYDVGLTSASDTIRMIWAYLLAMIEVDRKFHTNHLGFLVFDEPRQQGAEKLSFDALLHRAAETANAKQQVIFATSEDRDLLDAMLETIDCHYIRFEQKILQPM